MASPQLPSLVRYLRKVAGLPEPAQAGDHLLLERFVRSRDEEAFGALLERHRAMVLGVCRRVLHNAHDAEDAFQATFLVLARRAGAIRHRELLANWLHGVAYRTALKARASVVRGQAPLTEVADPAAAEPFAELAWREMQEALDGEVRRLPTRYQAPVVLCYLEGKTYTEAAQQLGWPAGTVSGRLARARELLRVRLGKRGLTLCAGLLGTVFAEYPLSAAGLDRLSTSTLKAAVLLVGARSAAQTASTPVIALAEGVLHAMFVTRLKTVALLVLLLIVMGLGAGLFAYSGLAGEQAKGSETVTSPAADPVEGPARAIKDGLSLTVRLDKRAYRLTDPIDLSFQLKNETNREVYIGDGAMAPRYHEAGPQRHFEVHLTVAKAPLTFWSGEMTEGDTAGARRVFKLKPGQTYAGAIRLSAGFDKDRDFARQPHPERGGSLEDVGSKKPHTLGKDARRYTLVLRYQVDPKTHGVFDPPAAFKEELLWTGTIDSPAVEFTVGDTDPAEPEKGKKEGHGTRVIPLGSMYGTLGHKPIKQPDGGDPGLQQLLREMRQGASNVFLVRGAGVKDAIQATSGVLTRFVRGVAPSVTREDHQAPLWAVVYFGMSGSGPPAWQVRSVEVQGTTIRIFYVQRESETDDEHCYFLWMPLGRLQSGLYTLELFDAERRVVTLMRRSVVPGQ